MEDRYLYKAKRLDNGEWVTGHYVKGLDMYGKEVHLIFEPVTLFYSSGETDGWSEIDPSTICQCTGLKDRNGNLIWENDILMCHGNYDDIVKAVFGEFSVINAATLEDVDNVIGWHYEVIPTDALSKCYPFCLSMPITEEYVNTCKFEVIGNVFDNPELLQ